MREIEYYDPDMLDSLCYNEDTGKWFWKVSRFDYVINCKLYTLNDKLHRLDGPAIEYTDGYKEWYVNGEELTENEFLEQCKK